MSGLRKRYEGSTVATTPTRLIDQLKQEYITELGHEPTKLILSANMYGLLVSQKAIQEAFVSGGAINTNILNVTRHDGMTITVVPDAEKDIQFE